MIINTTEQGGMRAYDELMGDERGTSDRREQLQGPAVSSLVPLIKQREEIMINISRCCIIIFIYIYIQKRNAVVFTEFH